MRIVAEFTPLQTVVYSILALLVVATALIVSFVVHQ